MPTLSVSCPSCWGRGEKGQVNPALPSLPCPKCEGGKVAVEAGCAACELTGWRRAGATVNLATGESEPVHTRCACVRRALEARGFYRNRRKRPA